MYGVMEVSKQFLCKYSRDTSTGDDALGHPKIYINLDKPEIQDCGYCGKRFVSDSFADQFEGNKIAY